MSAGDQTLQFGRAIPKKNIILYFSDWQRLDQSKDYFASRIYQVQFCMAIGNVEIMHECFPEHLLMGTARMK